MICMKCDKDFCACVCPDLEERFGKILESEHVIIGEDYKRRIREHIERSKLEQTTKE